MPFEHVNSLLIADIGNVHTRLVLIDLVEGQYRLIASSRARTTAEPPLNSVALGLEHAAQSMTELIGRKLVDAASEQIVLTPEAEGHGVDEFLATSSAGRPMKVFLIGLTPEISIASGRRALAGTYVTVTDTLSTDDLRSTEDKINAILRDEPDLILIVGGTDNGADTILIDLIQTVQTALSLIRRGSMPNVLFAGNHALKKQVDELLSPITNVFFAKNVRPTLPDEQLFPAQIELALVYDDYRSKSHGGFSEVGRFSQVGVVPTTQGYISTIRYMTDLPQEGIGPLCIDVGSANSLAVAGVHGEPHFAIRTDLGIGHNMVSTLAAVTPAQVLRWLPFDISENDLWDYAHNKALRPATIPITAEELMIEQAFAREIVRLLMGEARNDWNLGQSETLPDFQPVIAAGAVLTETQHPGMAAMLLLDALQPTDRTDLKLDPHNLISALGVVSYLKPLVTVQALESGGLINLGTAFSPRGRVRYGQDAMQIQIRQADGKTLNHRLRSGEIWIAPLLPGIQTQVEIRLRRGLTIDGKQRIKARVTTGAAGIIFDARGRPLVMPRTKDRAARFMQWQLAMTGREYQPSSTPADLMPDIEDLSPVEDADALLS